VEEVPDFSGSRAEEQHVVDIFIRVAGEAGGGGGKVVPKPSFVGGEPFLPSQPAENLAFERGRTPPNRRLHNIYLQLPEGVDIETFV
jgi:hypothetical protein